MFKKYNDKSLIEGIRLQDSRALKYAYSTYYPMVKNHVIRNSGDNSDVEEVLQESIIVLYRQIQSNEIKLTTDLKGYFFGIVRMVWNNMLRQKQKHTDLDIDITDENAIEYENDKVLLERVVARAMSRLKPECQQVILLFSQGVDYEEIALKTGLKSGEYARRKKYLCKEMLMDFIKSDPEYRDHLDLK
ncbi:MAG: RNA polymerase sigma factor [Bacteroidales bacterium]|nr:RNA polymerase sigma factor [Bacteroidales bacterium]